MDLYFDIHPVPQGTNPIILNKTFTKHLKYSIIIKSYIVFIIFLNVMIF